jgi:DNA polymerase III gamma/tau subunit
MNLAQELRPKSLDEVVGQEHVKTAIRKGIEGGCQRWLFHGPTGTGKTSLAHIVARGMGSEEVFELNAAELGIEEISELVKQINCYPMRGKYRVIILDEAQALTDAAKSALLKPLENDSDPVNVWILCTMEVKKLHRALRDRCKAFELKEMGPQERRELVARAAKHLGYTDDTDRFIRQLDAKEAVSARDIFASFEKYADGMRAEDALA